MKLVAKTLHGLEAVLAGELEALEAKNIQILKRAVSFDANKELLYKSNLHLRTALRILQPLTSFSARNEDELYKADDQEIERAGYAIEDTVIEDDPDDVIFSDDDDYDDEGVYEEEDDES